MAALSRATRRIIVMHLLRDGMSVPEIAAELGVSRDTVRRDAQQDAPAAHQVMRPDADPVAPQVARHEPSAAGQSDRPQDAEDAPDAHQALRPVAHQVAPQDADLLMRPDASRLLVPMTAQLRADLAVLTAAHRALPGDVTRFAVHQAAQAVRHSRTARAAGEGRRTA